MLCHGPHRQQRAPRFWKFADVKIQPFKKERGIEVVAVHQLQPPSRPQGGPLVGPGQQTEAAKPVEGVLDGADTASGSSGQLGVGWAGMLPAGQQAPDPDVACRGPLAVRQRPVGLPEAVAELGRRHRSPFAEGRQQGAEPHPHEGVDYRLGMSDADDCQVIASAFGSPFGGPSLIWSLRFLQSALAHTSLILATV